MAALGRCYVIVVEGLGDCSMVLMGTLDFLLEGWFGSVGSAPEWSQGESAPLVDSES